MQGVLLQEGNPEAAYNISLAQYEMFGDVNSMLSMEQAIFRRTDIGLTEKRRLLGQYSPNNFTYYLSWSDFEFFAGEYKRSCELGKKALSNTSTLGFSSTSRNELIAAHLCLACYQAKEPICDSIKARVKALTKYRYFDWNEAEFQSYLSEGIADKYLQPVKKF